MRVLTATVLALCFSTPAFSQVRPMGLEVSPFAGMWEGDSVFETGPVFGARLRFDPSRLFGVELNYGVVSTKQLAREQAAIEEAEDVNVGLFGANGVLHLAYGHFTPYLTAGIGFVSVDDVSYGANAGAGASGSEGSIDVDLDELLEWTDRVDRLLSEYKRRVSWV